MRNNNNIQYSSFWKKRISRSTNHKYGLQNSFMASFAFLRMTSMALGIGPKKARLQGWDICPCFRGRSCTLRACLSLGCGRASCCGSCTSGRTRQRFWGAGNL